MEKLPLVWSFEANGATGTDGMLQEAHKAASSYLHLRIPRLNLREPYLIRSLLLHLHGIAKHTL